MASGIPPLLPASPPPMCKDDFNEVETDDSANEDNDEFGDFIVATATDHSNKPTNDVHTPIEPTISETNSCDATVQDSSQVPENVNSSQEISSDEVKPSEHLTHEEDVDELKSSTDDDAIINSFVTVEMPSVAEPLFDSPRLEAEISNSNHQSATDSNHQSIMNDDFKNDLTFDHEITPAVNNFTINSPSSSDSDSIDIPDDSFIICDDANSNQTPDFLAASESATETGPVFGEFVASNETSGFLVEGTSSFHVEDTSGFHLEDHKVSSDALSTDIPVLDADFGTAFQASDDFFQPFTGVSAPFPNDKVTELQLEDVFGAENMSSDPLSSIQTTQDTRMVEIAAAQFSCEFDDDDDDFSDFVSPTIQVQSGMVETTSDPLKMALNTIENLPMSFCGPNDFTINEKSLFEQDKLSTTSQELNWTEIFCAPAEDHIEVNVNTIEGKLKCSSVWCRIKDIESSPALHYNWNDSDTNKLLLATLCVDSRNILFGPRWSSEVPRFASNLGFTPLVPQKAADKSPQNEFPELCPEVTAKIVAPFTELNPTMSSVPDAHFDWNNSGLTNPLDSSKPEKNPVAEDYELQNSVSILNGSETKTLSSEATKILNSLPNLVVMEKQYIVFPIR